MRGATSPPSSVHNVNATSVPKIPAKPNLSARDIPCRISFPGVAYAPNGFRTVVGDHERAIGCDRDAHGPAPHRAIGVDETRNEILVLALGVPVIERHANDFISRARGAVPGTVLGGEYVALILRRKLRSLVKGHSERSAMRPQQNVGHDGLLPQFRLLGQTGVVVITHVIPGPAVEAAFFNGSDVVGNKVVADHVPFVYRAPELPGVGIDRDTGWIANSRSVDLHEFTFGRELENVGAVMLAWMRIGIVNVGSRADGDKELAAVQREGKIARPMAAARRQFIDDRLRRTAGLQIAIVIGIAHNGVRIAEIDPLRIIAKRIKRNPVIHLQTCCEDGLLFGLAVLQPAKDLHLPGIALRDEQVSIRSFYDLARGSNSGYI